MGIDLGTLQFLLNAERIGVSMERVLTIGRQYFYISPDKLREMLQRNGRACTSEEAARIWNQEKGYCEPFLKYLGAGEISSMDFSSYENATILHDMNQPLPAQWDQKFSLVLDGGSLEHVFYFPTGLANCMRAVELGGHFVTVTPANQLMGHGFYQFSPELFWRVLGPDNGFEMTRMVLYEQPYTGTWYQVADPARVGCRVLLENRKRAYLIVCARRTSIKPILSTTPQQSDYTERWEEGKPASKGTSWKQKLPPWVGDLYRRMNTFDRRFYRPAPASLDSPFWNGDKK